MSRVAIATLSVLDRLGPMHLTTRETDPSDGRAVLVTLTASGREVVQGRRARFVEVIEQMLAALDADSFHKLVEALPTPRQLAAMSYETRETK